MPYILQKLSNRWNYYHEYFLNTLLKISRPNMASKDKSIYSLDTGYESAPSLQKLCNLGYCLLFLSFWGKAFILITRQTTSQWIITFWFTSTICHSHYEINDFGWSSWDQFWIFYTVLKSGFLQNQGFRLVKYFVIHTYVKRWFIR